MAMSPDNRHKMKASIYALVLLLAAIGSVLLVIFSVLAFVFAAATSASDPNERYEPLIFFTMMFIVIGVVMAGWSIFWLLRRK
jgi:uncharacterized membrane protein